MERKWLTNGAEKGILKVEKGLYHWIRKEVDL